MPLTAEQINTELEAIRSQILALTAQSTSSYSSQGRQVVMESARGKLEVLYKREAELELKLARAQRGGIPVRYGISTR